MVFVKSIFSVCMLSFVSITIVFPCLSSADPLETVHLKNLSSQGNPLLGVTYGNRTFVTVGADGTILTSSDGINWTTKTSGTHSNLYGVAY